MFKICFWIFCFSIPMFAASNVKPLSVDDPKWRWMDKQINKQFAPFRKGITKEMLDETMKNAPKIP
ncbi:MAG: hypothetical protein WAM28_05805, partial [Chlamydiales bacterium]